jgi:hypothetical protein
MKRFALSLATIVLAGSFTGSLTGCDSSTNAKTTTKIDTVYDTTYYNDRFALNMPVVDGRWKLFSTVDSADAFFTQDSDTVSAYILWSGDSSWLFTNGTVSKTGFTSSTYNSTTKVFTNFIGNFTDSANHVKTKMTGTYYRSTNNITVNWTAVRRD